MRQKTFSVVHVDGAWKIVEADRVVASYATRAIAVRRALEKAQAAYIRGDHALVLFYNRDNRLEGSRAVPHARKPRAGSAAQEQEPLQPALGLSPVAPII